MATHALSHRLQTRMRSPLRIRFNPPLTHGGPHLTRRRLSRIWRLGAERGSSAAERKPHKIRRLLTFFHSSLRTQKRKILRKLTWCMDSSHKRRWYSVSALSRRFSLFRTPLPFLATASHSSSSSSCAEGKSPTGNEDKRRRGFLMKQKRHQVLPLFCSHVDRFAARS